MTLLSTSKSDTKRAGKLLAADAAENFVAADPAAASDPLTSGMPDPQEPGGMLTDGLEDVIPDAPEPDPIEGKLLTVEELIALNASDEGKKLLSLGERWYEECRNSMSERRRQWRMNEAFERGRQHIYYDKDKETVADLPRKKGIPRAVVNKMRGIMRTEVAKFTAQKPTAEALPASNDPEDIRAAEAAKQVWESLYDRLDVAAKQRRVARWQSVAGLGYLKPFWNEAKYDPVTRVFGDIDIEVVPPYNVFIPDVYTEDITDQPYIIHAYLLPIDTARFRYGDVLGAEWKPSQSRAEQTSEFGRIYERGGDTDMKQALVKEVWVNPEVTEEFPKGGMLIIVDHKIVEASIDGFPPGYTRYPLVKFEHIPTGTYFPACVFDDAIPIQREINRSMGQVIQLKNAMILNGFFFEEGSIDEEKLTTRPGQAIPYTPGYSKPTPIAAPQMPEHLPEVLNRSDMQLEDISGQHASTQGKHAPGLEAATAIGQLIEQDEAYISPAIASIEKGMGVVASMGVTLFSVYATTERVVKVVGADQGLDVVLLRGADIMGGTDIRMQSASALPQSKSAQQALFIDLAKLGAIDPQDLPKLIQMPNLTNYLDQQMTRADENAAQRENIVFRSLAKQGEAAAQAYIDAYYRGWEAKQAAGDPETFTEVPAQPAVPPEVDPATNTPIPGTGQPEMPAQQVPLAAPGLVPVNEWDDHAVHIYVLDLLIKSQWWSNCPKAVKAEVQKHRAAHVAALQQQQMAAAPPADPSATDPAPQPGDQPDYTGRTEDQIQKGD